MKLKKSILITGGSGFIGKNLVNYFLKKFNYNIINYDSLVYSSNNNLDLKKFNKKKYFFFKGNINNQKKINEILKLFKPFAIINLAAESHVDRSIDDPLPFIKTNINGTFNLLTSSLKYYNSLKIKEKKIFRFIHISTDEVYGDLNFNFKPFEETNKYMPSSPYSASKASSDHLVHSWFRTFNFPSIITNCSNNYGSYQHPEKFIPHVILSCILKKKIPIYGNGKQIRDWIHVDDHCEAISKILKNGSIGESYNIGSDNEQKNIFIAKSICKIFDKLNNKFKYSKLIKFVEDRPGHDKRYAINSKKIKKDTGWSSSIDFNKGLEETVMWYIVNSDWWLKIIKSKYKLQRIGKVNKK